MPGIAGARHFKCRVEQGSHVFRVKLFLVHGVEGMRDVGEVIVNAVPLGDQVNLVEIADALGVDDGTSIQAGTRMK